MEATKKLKVRSIVDRRSPFPRRKDADIWETIFDGSFPERSRFDRRQRGEDRIGWERISQWSSIYLHNLYLA